MSDKQNRADAGKTKPEAAADAGKGAGKPAEKGEEKLVHLRPPRPCPTCGKPSSRQAYPFCSARCAEVDLNRWLSGQFVIPGRTLTDTDDDEADGFGAPVNRQGEAD
jgi:endogenous inhibitor of DNA gyrase (YacG/DUF329 family)